MVYICKGHIANCNPSTTETLRKIKGEQVIYHLMKEHPVNSIKRTTLYAGLVYCIMPYFSVLSFEISKRQSGVINTGQACIIFATVVNFEERCQSSFVAIRQHCRLCLHIICALHIAIHIHEGVSATQVVGQPLLWQHLDSRIVRGLAPKSAVVLTFGNCICSCIQCILL